MKNIEIRTFKTIDDDGKVYYRREVVDELLGLLAYDTCSGAYIDLFVEGASTPFDTLNVWRSGEKRREDDDRVLGLILDRFRTYREEEGEE